MIRKIAWFSFFMTMSVSCLDEPDCFALNNNIVQISFKNLSDGTANAIQFQSIDTRNKENTTVLVYTNQNLSVVSLPLDYLTNQTVYTFRHSDSLEDKLTFKYLSKAQFVSDSCGQRFVLSGLSIGETTFDSVRLLSNIPFRASTTATTTLEIYR